jgi:cyanophycinase
MAADDPQLEAQRVAELFAQYGANTTWIPVTTSSNNADDSAVVSLTIGQDGFFFASGTRSRVLTALRRNGVDSQVLTAIRVKLQSGAMVAGNSAGMAVLVGTFFSFLIKSADFSC